MLIVSAKITTKPGKRDAFIKGAQPCIAATRKEDGCHFYELYASTENPNLVMYFEKWTDRAALDKHLKAPHMAEFDKVKAEQDLVEGDMDLGIYEIK